MEIGYEKDVSGIEQTETERDSICNSISTITSTPYASAPFIRPMGILHYPPESDSELDRNKYAAEAIKQCTMWEDRTRLKEVHFDENGKIRMVISNGQN